MLDWLIALGWLAQHAVSFGLGVISYSLVSWVMKRVKRRS